MNKPPNICPNCGKEMKIYNGNEGTSFYYCGCKRWPEDVVKEAYDILEGNDE